MANVDRQAWFQEKYGRPPASQAEIEGAYMREACMTNPKTSAKAQRVVSYAEAQGGLVLAYAKAMWGHYWGPTMPKSPDKVEEELNLTEDQSAEIFAQIQRATHRGGTAVTPEAC